MTTTITNAVQQNIFDTTGVSPIAAATITTETLTNTNSGLNGSFNIVNNLVFLRGGGTESVDYLIGQNGAPVLLDQIVNLPTGASVDTYFGSEALNPFLASVPPMAATATSIATPGFTPPNPGYALTQYTYAANNVFQQVLAVESNGKSFIGTSLGAIS